MKQQAVGNIGIRLFWELRIGLGLSANISFKCAQFAVKKEGFDRLSLTKLENSGNEVRTVSWWPVGTVRQF